jgi:hypothetical protein
MKDHLFFLYFLLTLLYSCRCKDNNAVHQIPETLKPYGEFLEGTYWVLRNDSSLIEDSIAVTSASNSLNEVSSECPNGGEKIDYSVQVFKLNISPNYFGNLSDMILSDEGLFFEEGNDTAYSAFKIPIPEDTTWSLYLDSLLVNGISYEEVYKLKSHGGSSFLDPLDSSNYFLAANIGLLKKQIFLPSGEILSWSLIRSHIVQ